MAPIFLDAADRFYLIGPPYFLTLSAQGNPHLLLNIASNCIASIIGQLMAWAFPSTRPSLAPAH